MKLTDDQKAAIERWAAQGATLSQIQDRLRSEYDVHLTYMEARLLLIDLETSLHEQQDTEEAPAPGEEAQEEEPAELGQEEDAPADGLGGLSLEVDELTLPGAVVSGKVTFSDGQTVRWYLDQYGRLGLQGNAPGYQPPPDDIPAFQRELQSVLRRRGY